MDFSLVLVSMVHRDKPDTLIANQGLDSACQVFLVPQIILKQILHERSVSVLETCVPVAADAESVGASDKLDPRIFEVWLDNGLHIFLRTVVVHENGPTLFGLIC